MGIENLIHKWKLPKTQLPSKDKVKMKIHEKIDTKVELILMEEDISTSGTKEKGMRLGKPQGRSG